MSYIYVDEPPESDAFLRRFSPYRGIPAAQPHETACLAAAFDSATRSIAASAYWAPRALTPRLAAAARRRGALRVADVLEVARAAYPQLRIEQRRGVLRGRPSRDVARVMLVPHPCSVGHALAATWECPAGRIWDPWPPGEGAFRMLQAEEEARWQRAGMPRIVITLR